MTQTIRAEARALGFDACGFAAAGDPDPEGRFAEWLARGCHGDMAWLARRPELRRDVRLWLPGAQSVVVVARNYYAPRPEPAEGDGLVARYAWGRDYHRVVGKMLRKLAAKIVEMAPGTECAISVDAGPVLEKFWAARAGVGFIGKNSLVIVPPFGSWVFLGVVATTLELAPDTPMPRRCGDCSLCMAACPARAIAAPGMVDARRCLSYHTVENRGDIPPDLRAVLGARVFGCDACQEVCPFNATPLVTTEPDFHPRPHQANPDLAELCRMDEDAFRARFAGTPLMRAKRAGLARNAEIALNH